MKKKTLLLLVMVALILSFGTVAYADEGVFEDNDWGFDPEGYNWEDPVFDVAGTQVNVWVGAEVPDGETVSRPTRVMMLVPRGVDAQVVDDYGLWVRLVRVGWLNVEDGRVPVQVYVFRPRTDQHSTYPVLVHVQAGDNFFTKEGRAGRMVRVNAWVPAP